MKKCSYLLEIGMQLGLEIETMTLLLCHRITFFYDNFVVLKV